MLLHLYSSISMCMWLAYTRQISSKSTPPRRSYNVISITENGGHGVAILIPYKKNLITVFITLNLILTLTLTLNWYRDQEIPPPDNFREYLGTFSRKISSPEILPQDNFLDIFRTILPEHFFLSVSQGECRREKRPGGTSTPSTRRHQASWRQYTHQRWRSTTDRGPTVISGVAGTLAL